MLYQELTLVEALETVCELAQDNVLDIDDYDQEHILYQHAIYQDECMGIVFDHIAKLKKGDS